MSTNRPTTDRVSRCSRPATGVPTTGSSRSAPQAQQNQEGGEEHRERRNVRAAAHARHRVGERSIGIVDAAGAVEVGGRREASRVAGAWHAGQPGPPVRDRPCHGVVVAQSTPPLGVVRVLDRRRGSGDRVSRSRAIGGRELPEQDAERPSVADDVVHCEQQHVLVVAEPDEPGAQQRRAREVERQSCVREREPTDRRVALVGAEPREIGHRQLEDGGPLHDLGFAVRGEGGAQALVPAHERIQAPREPRDVEGTAQAQHALDVAMTASGRETLREPDPLLHRRHRERLRIAFADDGDWPRCGPIDGRPPLAIDMAGQGRRRAAGLRRHGSGRGR
ncbi:MAG: hypothetical protein IPG84_20390 [Betaproteobacteria bacterium]|nr:hypothetical protein [Betaproteobacteria bacterium]